MAYKLLLPQESKIHPVFHVALLKEYHGEIPGTTVSLPDVKAYTEVAPRALVDQRVNAASGVVEVLVEWEGVPKSEATWEQLQLLQEAFPFIHLEGKVIWDIDTNHEVANKENLSNLGNPMQTWRERAKG